MNPESILNPVEKAGRLSSQYGFEVVVCFTVIIFLGAVLFFVLTFLRDLVKNEIARNTAALQSLTEANNAAHAAQVLAYERISKDVKDGFESMQRADSYVREEHKELLKNQIDLKEFILEKLGIVCKVTKQ